LLFNNQARADVQLLSVGFFETDSGKKQDPAWNWTRRSRGGKKWQLPGSREQSTWKTLLLAVAGTLFDWGKKIQFLR